MKVYNLIKKEGWKYEVYGLVAEIENNTNPNLPTKRYYLLTGEDDGYELSHVESIGSFIEEMEKKSIIFKEITDTRLFAQCISIISSCINGTQSLKSDLKNNTFTFCNELEQFDFDLLNEEINGKCLHQIKP